MAKKKKNGIPEKDAMISNSDTVVFDVLKLLADAKFNTKPNTAKFLKQYVKSIRISTMNKIDLWPKIHYDICKCVIKFNDNSSLIKDYAAPENFEKFYLFKQLDEVDLRDKDKKLIDNFFNVLTQFKYIRDGKEDVKVFSTDVEKTNEQLDTEIRCA